MGKGDPEGVEGEAGPRESAERWEVKIAMSCFEIISLTRLPKGLAMLERESLAAGFGMVTRLRREWEDGSLRFDREGEILLGAFAGERLIGVGGLSHDPYLHDPKVGRLRHLYVLQAARRGGVGREIVARLVAPARGRFERLRLSTAEAGAFYEALGWRRIEEAGATHGLELA
jgi:GNAT superfamily N-acetyltransferase